jgi:hypothetical protein
LQVTRIITHGCPDNPAMDFKGIFHPDLIHHLCRHKSLRKRFESGIMDVFDRRRRDVFLKALPMFCLHGSPLFCGMVSALTCDGSFVEPTEFRQFVRSFYEAVSKWNYGVRAPHGNYDIDCTTFDYSEGLMFAFEAMALHLGAFRFKDLESRPLEELTTSNDILYVMVLMVGRHLYDAKVRAAKEAKERVGEKLPPNEQEHIRKEFSTSWVYNQVHILSTEFMFERCRYVLFIPGDTVEQRAFKTVRPFLVLYIEFIRNDYSKVYLFPYTLQGLQQKLRLLRQHIFSLWGVSGIVRDRSENLLPRKRKQEVDVGIPEPPTYLTEEDKDQYYELRKLGFA